MSFLSLSSPALCSQHLENHEPIKADSRITTGGQRDGHKAKLFNMAVFKPENVEDFYEIGDVLGRYRLTDSWVSSGLVGEFTTR